MRGPDGRESRDRSRERTERERTDGKKGKGREAAEQTRSSSRAIACLEASLGVGKGVQHGDDRARYPTQVVASNSSHKMLTLSVCVGAVEYLEGPGASRDGWCA